MGDRTIVPICHAVNTGWIVTSPSTQKNKAWCTSVSVVTKFTYTHKSLHVTVRLEIQKQPLYMYTMHEKVPVQQPIHFVKTQSKTSGKTYTLHTNRNTHALRKRSQSLSIGGGTISDTFPRPEYLQGLPIPRSILHSASFSPQGNTVR